jgi:hypothetical protein
MLVMLATTVVAQRSAAAVSVRPTVHRDGVDPSAGPLDLATASLAQQGTRLELAITTRGTWRDDQLSMRAARSLCVTLAYGTPARPRAQLCVAARLRRTVLLRTSLDRAGVPVGRATVVHGDVGRADDRTVLASITPLDAGVPRGRFAWRIDARWSLGSTCRSPQDCSDRLPERGFVPARASIVAEPPCFGAAARDRLHPCRNPRLLRTVTPTPDGALLTPNAPCRPAARVDLITPCTFGVQAEQARSTVALVGDSHAAHWRGALEVASQALRWAGISVTRSSCPFTDAYQEQATSARTGRCTSWKRQVRRWFTRHPEVRTVFVSEDAHTTFGGDAVGGYRSAWHSLPRSVRRIFVLRDTPGATQPQAACIRHLLRAHRPIGTRCAQPRRSSLLNDPAARAARDRADPRVRLIDLTSYMCGRTLCPAVIGGVLVRKDGRHLTRLFATTLGPYVLRSIRRHRVR